jgi:hypothetical protein
VVVQKVFERAARSQARALGAANLPVCSYPATPLGADVGAVAAQLADDIVSVLQRPAGN